METPAAGSTQPRLHGAALRNLAKANRPVVTDTPNGAAYWQTDCAPQNSSLTSVSAGAGGVLKLGGSALLRAVGWMTHDPPLAARPAAQPPKVRRRKKEDELPHLAAAARFAVLSNRFSALAPLSEEERAILQKLDYAQRRVHQAGSDIVVEGEQPSPIFIVSGWASRVRVLSTGRRQILGLLVPGDGMGLHREAEPALTATVTAITTVETVDASVLAEVARDVERFPGLILALERIAAQENAFSDNQILRLGALTEARRLAHLLLELQWRLSEVKLGNERVFPLPLTHETMADMLGMEPTDVKRALRALRVRRLFALRYSCASVLSKKAFDLGGDFRPPEISAYWSKGFQSVVTH